MFSLRKSLTPLAAVVGLVGLLGTEAEAKVFTDGQVEKVVEYCKQKEGDKILQCLERFYVNNEDDLTW